ncbi:hypothetical protein ACFVWN_12185 [Nocardiopsis flavescens]|uniref:hypothetical protein n=1 Tax=Nocardiopsis flavescens TaxID=758803 RepID=UPI003666D1BC
MRQDEALDALEQAEALKARMRGQGGWYAVFGVGYAAMSCGLILAVGLLPEALPWTMGVFAVVLAVLIAYAVTRSAQPRNLGALHLGMMGAWTAVYLVTLIVGINVFPGEPAWWVSGALLSALPPLAVAYVALRQIRNPR